MLVQDSNRFSDDLGFIRELSRGGVQRTNTRATKPVTLPGRSGARVRSEAKSYQRFPAGSIALNVKSGQLVDLLV